jgi:DGQHR domain-containing protein
MSKKANASSANRLTVHALKVNQWLKDWDVVAFDKNSHRRKPQPHFYIFSLSAKQLRALADIYRRDAKNGKKRSQDLAIQRSHELTRSEGIAEYIRYGYPWSDLSKTEREGKFNDLRKPGWLPTAIVINILTEDDKRKGDYVASTDLIKLKENGDIAEIVLPFGQNFDSWSPTQRAPLEIIDGQHRLLAFDELDKDLIEDYQLPVVAFHGLDLSWQAYLFWTINIKPKRINPSLAFDLYPLLRTQDWLDRFEGHKIYREARAQELTESIWSSPSSIWHQKINMLGEKNGSAATQAAWIRALLKSYIKSSEGRGVSVGGLFGAPVGQDNMSIPWSRLQQAAFLIEVWNSLAKAVKNCNATWAESLRSEVVGKKSEEDPAFFSSKSLLNNDQGLNAILAVTNDIFFLNADSLKLADWELMDANADVESARDSLLEQKNIMSFVRELSEALAKFDWRSSNASGLKDQDKMTKLAFRGGSGYKIFKELLVKHLRKQAGSIGKAAKSITVSE